MPARISPLTSTTLLGALALALVASCGSTADEPWSPTTLSGERITPVPPGTVEPSPTPAVIGDTWQSACKRAELSDGADGLGGALEATAQGGTVTVTHRDAEYNCAAKVVLKVTVDAATRAILVQEIVTNPDEIVDCNCPFDLSVTISGLTPGSWTVTVTAEGGAPAGTTTVTVPTAPLTGPTQQSTCKGAPLGSNGPSGPGGTLDLSAQGATVTIAHLDAPYNCAAKVEMQVTVDAVKQEIHVQEVITNPGEVANCYCTFDLAVSVGGLAPGTYAVKVQGESGELLGSITVP